MHLIKVFRWPFSVLETLKKAHSVGNLKRYSKVIEGQLSPLLGPPFPQTHPSKFYMAILFNIIEMFGNYVFDDPPPPPESSG